MNEADQDTSRGVEIEEKLDAMANEVDELQEANGFLTEEEIASMQLRLIELSDVIVS